MIPFNKLNTSMVLAFIGLCVLFSVGATVLNVKNLCRNKRTCHECIQTKNCAWCLLPDNGNKSRCFPSYFKSYCAKDFIWNPTTKQNFTSNRKLTLGGYARSGEVIIEDIVQIRPQRVSLKLRINEVHSLPLRFSQAKDYPIDLYYLMDLSKSMEDDKAKLSALGDLLSDTMRNITSNFRLGFGSFDEKVIMPFTSTAPTKLISPCDGCEPPYGFKNVMSLSTDTSRFSTEVRNAPISGNLDAPEGGFDAIVQAIVCREQIGWREQSRRLLVFSTDDSFHYAGAGKLAGLIEPNDEQCHLDSEGLYTHSIMQDYPSIAQINRIVIENSINLIFAVTANQKSIYKKLSKTIEGSSTATLSDDSSNVVDLVRDEYNKISSSIEMRDNATNHVRITYFSSCLNGDSEIPTSKCDGLKVGDIVNFTAQILVTSCPTDPNEWHQVIEIYPVGINETLLIDLEMICTCPCENPDSDDYQKNSALCNNHGTQICGTCECDDSYIGHNCECSSVDVNEKHIGCRANNMTTIACNGRGICLCDVCVCDKRFNPTEIISGKYCECDNFSCDRHDQQLCSGPDHGVCECGSCICKPGWTGDACDCKASNETCISPNDGKICSGQGECECGVCKCKKTKESYFSGQFCESSRCHELKDCVQCQMFKTGPLRNLTDCIANCTTFVTKGSSKIEIGYQNEENICIFYDENDCKFTFKYSEDKDIVEVYAELHLECSPQVLILRMGLGITGTIIFVGLGTLFLWKIFTAIHDSILVAKFEQERMEAEWCPGGDFYPISSPTTTTFRNPSYNR
ncbi:integrin beta-PS-like isoform X2 [Lucilia sericata]|uniref:integrin beta-PS-like isoform X2 n=1 Tax=Lucilia sericata TaxID=13632 RepID=UPI0018A87B1A|nr:integrin beta-PS-like isoform X2 [Lucilia sericata]